MKNYTEVEQSVRRLRRKRGDDGEPLGGRVVSGSGRSTWAGILALAFATAVVAGFVRGTNLFIFNSLLLAVVGCIGLDFLIGTAGQLSIGNGAFLAIGAFSSVFLIRAGLNPVLSAVLGALVSATVGALVSLTASRLRGFYMALSTLALQFIVAFIVQQYQDAHFSATGFIMSPLFADSGINGQQLDWLGILFALVATTIWVMSRLMSGRSGRAWRMIRDHEEMAATMGIQVQKYKVVAFVISSALIGLQGGLTLLIVGSVNSDTYGLTVAIEYVAMTLIGGLDSLAGAVIGATVVVFLPVVIPNIVNSVGLLHLSAGSSGAVSEIVYGLLVVVFVVSSPDGLVGVLKTIWARRRGLAA